MDDLKVYVKFSHKNKKINFVKCIFRLFIKSLNCEDYQNFEEFLILKKYLIIFIIPMNNIILEMQYFNNYF